VLRQRKRTTIRPGPTANGKPGKPLILTSGREAAFRPEDLTSVIPTLVQFLTALRLINYKGGFGRPFPSLA